MTEAELSPNWLNYEQNFIRDVHHLLVLGYADVSAHLNADHEEEDITGLLVGAINTRLDTLGGRFTRYFVTETSPASNDGRLGKRRRELDIVVQCSLRSPRTHFIFEAKRLRTPGYPVGKYVGGTGLLCFVHGDYASNCHFAGMVGYIQSHTPDRWFEQLLSKFNSDSSDSLRIIRSLSRIAVDPNLPHEWISEHMRDNGTSITVYHVLLVCC